jgi:hypothetical protein
MTTVTLPVQTVLLLETWSRFPQLATSSPKFSYFASVVGRQVNTDGRHCHKSTLLCFDSSKLLSSPLAYFCQLATFDIAPHYLCCSESSSKHQSSALSGLTPSIAIPRVLPPAVRFLTRCSSYAELFTTQSWISD